MKIVEALLPSESQTYPTLEALVAPESSSTIEAFVPPEALVLSSMQQ